MRKLDFHKVQGKGGGYDGNDIQVTDEPGQGGACHQYWIVASNADEKVLSMINFQNGPIQEAGVNGVQQEDLLAIVIDRLAAFQAGPFANEYNAIALAHTRDALKSLQKRTLDRIARSVEGYNVA